MSDIIISKVMIAVMTFFLSLYKKESGIDIPYLRHFTTVTFVTFFSLERGLLCYSLIIQESITL